MGGIYRSRSQSTTTRSLRLRGSRKVEKYCTLDDLALEHHTQINVSDTVESLKLKIASAKFVDVVDIHFSIMGRNIPDHVQLREHLDLKTRFLLRWSARE